MHCPSCAHSNPDTAQFCANCGEPVSRHCPACNAVVALTQNFCSSCGNALTTGALASTGSDEGERRQATVVFSDLSGYTALNEQLDPEEVEEIMGRVKREATAIVERHGGIVNQFIGDEIMALFGVPVARRDDPQRAVRAALEVHGAVREISAELAPSIGRDLNMHTGINSGLVIVRRSDARSGRYQLTGDTINTAARLLTLARGDEVVVGQDTWREIAGDFDAEAGPPTEVKGKEKPIVPWRIRGAVGVKAQEHKPLIGRATEVAHFGALARACLASRCGGVVVLRGDPGIGKSRLAAELRTIATTSGFATHAASVLDFSAERGRDAVRAVARALERTAPDLATAPEQEVCLADLLDLPLRPELRALAAAMSETIRNRGTVEALRHLVQHACALAPTLILVEDLHWADDWTMERLLAIADMAASMPLLLVLTTRPENDPTQRLGLARSTTTLDLRPLGVEDAYRLAAQFTSVSLEAARDYVMRADGNPLFLEQLLLNVSEVLKADLPGSIQALILARMDRLPAADRTALQVASVLGQRFSLDAMRHLMESPTQDCRVLLEHCLVRADGDQYLFWHALIRDGAYQALLKSRRRQLHARAAQWLGARDPALAAEHFDRAEDPRAPAAYLAAVDAELTRYRFERALELVRRGLDLASESADRHALTSRKAHILLEAGKPEEAIEAWQAARDLAPDDVARCRALIGIAACMRILDRSAQGLAALDEAEQFARGPGLQLERSRLHHLRGNLYFGLGRVQACLQEHELALQNALDASAKDAEANALGGLGDAYYIRGRMRSAHEQFGRCVELARRLGLGRIEVANMHMLGWTAHYQNRLRTAQQELAASLNMALAVSHRRVEVIARSLLAYVGGWLIGEVDTAQQHIDLALPVARELGARRFEGQLMTYHAQLELRRGNRSRACDLAREALAFCRVHGMQLFGPTVLGLLARASERADEIARCNAEAIELLDGGAISHNYFEFYALAIEGALDRGQWDEAEQHCLALEAYTAAEPLPWSDLLIARGRGLAQFGRGGRSADLLATLHRARAQAAEIEYNIAVPALDLALAMD